MKRTAATLPLLLFFLSSVFAADPFPVETPESQGMSSTVLREMSEWVRAEGHDLRSMLVLRNGSLVLEWYAGDVSRDHNHNLFSVTKSVVATLVGLAIDEGDIENTDQSLATLFPKSKGLESNPAKAAITLEDLLTMRSGLPQARANQPSGPQKAMFDRIHEAPDRLAFILDELPMPGTPGSKFAYGNIEPQLALAAIEEQSGDDALRFAKRHLFDPLEFENVGWVFPDSEGRVPGGYGLRLRAIDLAKIGQLYLNQGQWEGEQILSQEWIAASTRDRTGSGYGYYWWIDSQNQGYSAKGVRGQRLEIFPEKGLVFVVTSDLPPAAVSSITNTLTNDYLLKALKSDEPLNTDAAEQALLKKELETAQQYRPDNRNGLPPARLPQD